PNLDPVAGLQLEGRDVGRDAIHGEVAVADELTSLRPGAGEAHAVDDAVEAELEEPEKALAGHPGPLLGDVEVAPELALEDAVDAADLLLFPELKTVVADLATADAVLAGRAGATLERALLRVAAAALQVEPRALPPAEPTDGSGVASHVV